MIDFTDRDEWYEEKPNKEAVSEAADEGCGSCGYCFKCAQGYAKAEMAYFDAAFDYESRWGIKCLQN